MLDPAKKIIRVSSVRWNKEKCPANTTPEDEPCPKQICLQEFDQPKTSRLGEKTSNGTSFHLPDPAPISPEPTTLIEKPTTQHPYATRSKTQSHSLESMACLANAKDINIAEPKTYNEAVKYFEWKNWEKAIKEEWYSLHKNNTWELVSWPLKQQVLRGKWTYKLKQEPSGEILRYKARWVVQGFEQEKDIDYNETFASMVKPMSY